MNQIILSALLGGLAGTVVAHWLVIRRDRRARKHAFGVFLQSLVYELEAFISEAAINAGNPAWLYDWQKANVPSLRVECARISQDICCPNRRAELAALLKQFATQRGMDTELSKKELRYQPQIDRLKAALQKMLALAT